MSDEHHEHDGGHELEALDAGQLFRIVGGLCIVVLISIIAVIQWFHKQQAELRTTRTDFTFLAEHQASENEMLEGIASVSDKVGKDPGMMAPVVPPPAGWIHPDDIKGGGSATPAAAAPADEPAEAPAQEPAEGEAAAEGADDGADAADPAEAAPEEDEAADEAAGEDDKEEKEESDAG